MDEKFRTRWVDSSEEDETIYSRKKREILVDEDALSPIEDGIMQGYEEGLDFTDEEDFLESYEEEMIV